ncbi:CopD family protein [Antribacter sp. KLBMP9083]|uniref:CopD family protein n=1 Tax=Antribacter soli TaxID=2910976 RepID=A0AA41U6K0_9MICO|nr:CopD family protein [Antribacter soli]MCF4121123.1 CopD family protein [Antribacter soli]
MTSALAPRFARTLLLAIMISIYCATPAAAHTKLASSDPAGGSTSSGAVAAVTLTFTLPVTPLGDTVVIEGPQGIVDAEITQAQDGTAVVATPGQPLTDGSYAVSWTVTAQDGHPLEGTLAFTVAEDATQPGATPGASTDADPPTSHSAHVMGSMQDHETPPFVDAAGRFGNAATLWGWLVAAGGLAFAGLALRGRDLVDVPVVLAGVRWTGALILAGLALRVAARSVTLVNGDIAAAVAPSAVADALAGTTGWVIGLQAAGALAVLAGTGRTVPGSAIAAAGVLSAGAGFVLDGHSNTMEPRWLVLTADIAHLAAAATWLGGVVMLSVVLRRRQQDGRDLDAALMGARFSVIGAVTLAVVGVTGTLLAIAILDRPAQLWETDWGLALLAKVAVVAVVGIVGAYSHFHIVPLLAAATSRRRHGRSSGDALRRSATPETALMIAIVLITGWLVGASTDV